MLLFQVQVPKFGYDQAKKDLLSKDADANAKTAMSMRDYYINPKNKGTLNDNLVLEGTKIILAPVLNGYAKGDKRDKTMMDEFNPSYLPDYYNLAYEATANYPAARTNFLSFLSTVPADLKGKTITDADTGEVQSQEKMATRLNQQTAYKALEDYMSLDAKTKAMSGANPLPAIAEVMGDGTYLEPVQFEQVHQNLMALLNSKNQLEVMKASDIINGLDYKDHDAAQKEMTDALQKAYESKDNSDVTKKKILGNKLFPNLFDYYSESLDKKGKEAYANVADADYAGLKAEIDRAVKYLQDEPALAQNPHAAKDADGNDISPAQKLYDQIDELKNSLWTHPKFDKSNSTAMGFVSRYVKDKLDALVELGAKPTSATDASEVSAGIDDLEKNPVIDTAKGEFLSNIKIYDDWNFQPDRQPKNTSEQYVQGIPQQAIPAPEAPYTQAAWASKMDKGYKDLLGGAGKAETATSIQMKQGIYDKNRDLLSSNPDIRKVFDFVKTAYGAWGDIDHNMERNPDGSYIDYKGATSPAQKAQMDFDAGRWDLVKRRAQAGTGNYLVGQLVGDSRYVSKTRTSRLYVTDLGWTGTVGIYNKDLMESLGEGTGLLWGFVTWGDANMDVVPLKYREVGKEATDYLGYLTPEYIERICNDLRVAGRNYSKSTTTPLTEQDIAQVRKSISGKIDGFTKQDVQGILLNKVPSGPSTAAGTIDAVLKDLDMAINGWSDEKTIDNEHITAQALMRSKVYFVLGKKSYEKGFLEPNLRVGENPATKKFGVQEMGLRLGWGLDSGSELYNRKSTVTMPADIILYVNTQQGISGDFRDANYGIKINPSLPQSIGGTPLKIGGAFLTDMVKPGYEYGHFGGRDEHELGLVIFLDPVLRNIAPDLSANLSGQYGINSQGFDWRAGVSYDVKDFISRIDNLFGGDSPIGEQNGTALRITLDLMQKGTLQNIMESNAPSLRVGLKFGL